jgi:hypothetical protein
MLNLEVQMRPRVDAGASRLLIDEPPIPISRTLATVLGLEEATILQQLHFRSVSGAADRQGRWAVQEHDGYNWVSWSPAGLLEDVPLGDSLSPHRRALANLRALGVVVVQQLGKARWNRANFYRIDHPRLNCLLDSRVASISANRADETPNCDDRKASREDLDVPCASDSTKPEPVPQVTESEQENPESAGERQASSDSLDSSIRELSRRLKEMIGQRPSDNQLWDRKRLAAILSTISCEGISAVEVERILDDPEVRYLSHVEKRLKVLVQAQRAARKAEREREEALRRDQVASEQAAESMAQERRAIEVLEHLDNQALAALSASVLARLPVQSLKAPAADAISARQLGSGMVRAVILAELERQPRSTRPSAEVLPVPSPALAEASAAEVPR